MSIEQMIIGKIKESIQYELENVSIESIIEAKIYEHFGSIEGAVSEHIDNAWESIDVDGIVTDWIQCQ